MKKLAERLRSKNKVTSLLSSKSDQNKKYIYRPLQAGQIRVLTLEPAATLDAPLHIRLAEQAFEGLKYRALSYSWDAQKSSCPVNCEGSTLYVTSNCVAAARRLRHTSSIVMLWIDAICIDQDNVDERSTQVKLMGDIYKRATQVVIWLGEGNPETDTAFSVLKLNQIAKSENPELYNALMKNTLKRLEQERHSSGTDIFIQLFSRSWFHRMWTVQEAVLAQLEEAIVMCGERTISWWGLIDASEELQEHGYTEGPIGVATQIQCFCQKWMTLRRIPGLTQLPNFQTEAASRLLQPEMRKLLQLARGKQSSDPKDKVFALYGVLNECGIPAPEPNYRSSTVATFTEWTKACILHDKNLHVIYEIYSRDRISDLPSWVPDWSKETLEEYAASSSAKKFRAAGDARSWVGLKAFPHLRLRVKFVDCIKACGEKPEIAGSVIETRGVYALVDPNDEMDMSRRGSRFRSWSTTMKQWIDVAEMQTKTPPSAALMAELLRVLSHEDVIGPRPLEPINDDLEAMVTVLNAMVQESPQKLPPESNSAGFSSELPLYASAFLKPEVREYLVARPWIRFAELLMGFGRTASRERIIFVTSEGWLGSAPHAIRSGDRIALVSGLDMPFIVRKTEPNYALIGPAYVSGLMNGEAWPEQMSELHHESLGEELEENDYGLQEIVVS